MTGCLYIVATPIGNLADISYRAITTLKAVDLILAEDTRHVRPLLQHYGIQKTVSALHQHNEHKASLAVIEKLQAGQNIALVSDAGTPLISDPGLPLVKLAKEAGIAVIPIPGACALITALSASGLAVTEFSFLGFLPRTSSARKTLFTDKATDPNTWAFYEASHRIVQTLEDMAAVLPLQREIVIARELTKLHETIVKTTIAHAVTLVQNDKNMQKGEFVVIVSGAEDVEEQQTITAEQEKILRLLLKDCSTKTAAAIAAELTGAKKKLLYQAALDLQHETDSRP